jgi:hypothetical protein
LENAQLTHPYCNSTYKAWLEEHSEAVSEPVAS